MLPVPFTGQAPTDAFLIDFVTKSNTSFRPAESCRSHSRQHVKRNIEPTQSRYAGSYCGCGAIGTSIAYHLAARRAEVVVLERNAVACAASGKSGGFLALDWCDGSPLMALARRSFALHAELAGSLVGNWGYRRMTTYTGELRRSAALTPGTGPGWISPDVAIAGQIGSTTTTAQVHPAAFTSGMMRAAEARGAKLRLGEVEGLLRRDGEIVGVLFDGEALAAVNGRD